MNTLSKTQKKKIRRTLKEMETVGIVEYIQNYRKDLFIELKDFVIDFVKDEI